MRKMTERQRDQLERLEDLPAERHERPRRFGECVMDPCPFIGCRYHLAADVSEDTGSITWCRGAEDGAMDGPTCALRCAGLGPHTLDEIGQILGLTRERVRQIELVALAKMRRAVAHLRDDVTSSPEAADLVSAWGGRSRITKRFRG